MDLQEHIVQQEFFPGAYQEAIQETDSLVIRTESNVLLRIKVLAPDIIRFRYSPEGYFDRDFSYATDPSFEPGEVNFVWSDNDDHLQLHTSSLCVHILKQDLRVRIYSKDGKLINEDEKGFHWETHPQYGGNIVKMSKVVLEKEHYYGLGDKPTHLNLRGRRFQNWGTDQYGFTKGLDPLYKNIPFYIGLINHRAYGIFFDNSFRTFFDFASERRSATSFWADGGEMNYYFIYGPDMMNVVERFASLTGRPEMPPMWSLGYQQSKWSYYPESEVRDLADKFREHRIPCDAIYLDIDYMDGFRCFTWDKEKFPNPKKMVSDLQRQGFKTVVIIDPGLKVDEDYWVFKEAFERDYFCRRADGPYLKGKVWPGECYFPDFTRPEVREWWAGLYRELIGEIGVAGVWNDMNEPALFEVPSKTFPPDVRHDYDGNPCSHRKAHNVYGMQMARATYEGVKRFSKDKRPLVITRSAYAGAQRFTSTWTGDNIASWEHLWVANVQVQRMALSGFSFVGSDIGGFVEHPSSELFIRWIQLGIFHPFCRVHSSGDHGNQEPWSFGQQALDIVRDFVELRYRLLPYLYTAFYQHARFGAPMVRSLVMYDQSDEDTYYRTDEFILGDHMLVCPILEAGAQGRYLYLPKGKWFRYWDDQPFEGGREQFVPCRLQDIPLFIREGAVIPHFPVMQYVGERPVDEVTLHVYHTSGSSESYLYEDAGDGYSYEKGIYNWKRFAVSGTAGSLHIQQKRSGHFDPSYECYRVVLHGLPFRVKNVSINGKHIDLNSFHENDRGQIELVVSRTFLDLELFGE